MNPQYPFPLNPNPNPNFFIPQFNYPPPPQLPPPSPPPPQPPQSQPQNPNPNSLPSLPHSLFSLKTLLQSSTSTLQSLSSLSLSSKSLLIQCPSNPNHWVPPSSLFLHSLHCPSPVEIDLESLQYPNTLKTDHSLNNFVQPLDDDNVAELCFSLDDYVGFDTNYFYRDCPGVVSSVDDDVSKRSFSLPGVLSVECANFVGGSGEGNVGFEGSSVRVLPSEIWAVGREVDQWSEYPDVCSWVVVKALVCVECVRESDLAMWVIENSPRFGVVVDVPMTDHMVVLLRICLKAIVREAASSYRCSFGTKCTRFECAVLVDVLRWLTSQLSILYNGVNAKAFVVAMLRYLLTSAASRASVFILDKNVNQFSGNAKDNGVICGHSSGEIAKSAVISSSDEQIFSRPIFVYQIAAAIAALHERSLLEDRIRALRNPLQLPAYQRSAEHSCFAKKADEERQKRPDYRPIVEHDSILNQRQHDQGTNKPKTKEELLAEERDYKRRRMSYRGKKSKRGAKEVMRDIIEEYMDAIKKTGGIGGLPEGDSRVSGSTSYSSAPDASSFKLDQSSGMDKLDGYQMMQDDGYNSRGTELPDFSGRRKRQKESYYHGRFEDERNSRDRFERAYHSRSPSRDKNSYSKSPGRDKIHDHSRDRFDRDYHSRSPRRDKDYYSKSPTRDRKHDQSREHRGYNRNTGDSETGENDHFKSCKMSAKSSKSSYHRDHKQQHSSSSSLRISSGHKDKRKLESPVRQRWKKHEYDNPDSFERVAISDRYDPSEATDSFDDHSDTSKFSKPES